MKRLLRELLDAGLSVTFRPNEDEPAVGEGEPAGALEAGVGEVAVEVSSDTGVVAAGFGSTPKEALWAAARDAFDALHDAADLDLELEDWEEDEVQKILSNPAYTGLGGFGRVVEDERWIASMTAAIAEEGAGPVLERMRVALETTFGMMPRSVTGRGWAETGRKAIERDGAEAYLGVLLRDLRAELGP